MENSEESAKQNIAEVINGAIDNILKDGPRKGNVETWKARIELVLNSKTPQPDSAAISVEKYHHNLFEAIKIHKGFPVASIVGGSTTESATRSIENFSDAEFKLVEPLLHQALIRSVEIAHEFAGQFKESEVQQSLMTFEGWAMSIPDGGSKDKSCRAAARSVRSDAKATASWAKRFLIVHRTDFMSEAKHIFACNRGAIAGTWSWRKYPECDIHNNLDGAVFLLRNSWAAQRGFINTTGVKFFDDVPVPGSNGCLCCYYYIYSLGKLPNSVELTSKGREALSTSRSALSEALGIEQGNNLKQSPWWRRIFAKWL